MKKKSYTLISGIFFTKEYMMEQNDIFKRKIYYDEIVKFYIKKNIHARFTTKDLVFITKTNKKKKICFAVGTCGIFDDCYEEKIIAMIKDKCPNAEFIKRKNIIKNIIEKF